MSAFKMEGGKQYQQIIGTRRQVFNGTAKKTTEEKKEEAQKYFEEANNKVQKYEVFKIKNADGYDCYTGFEKYKGIVLTDNQNTDSCSTDWEVVTPSRFHISTGLFNTHYLRKKE